MDKGGNRGKCKSSSPLNLSLSVSDSTDDKESEFERGGDQIDDVVRRSQLETGVDEQVSEDSAASASEGGLEKVEIVADRPLVIKFA